MLNCEPYPCFPSTGAQGFRQGEVNRGRAVSRCCGGSLWITNQTRPDIPNDVWAIAQHSYDPKVIHWKANCNILVYRKATAVLGLVFYSDSDDKTWIFSSELCVDSVYASKTTNRRLVSGAPVLCGSAPIAWPSK